LTIIYLARTRSEINVASNATITTISMKAGPRRVRRGIGSSPQV
jgi:hypothetical protein